MKFPSHLNCDGKIVSEMGPWTGLFSLLVTDMELSEVVTNETNFLKFIANYLYVIGT